MKTLSKKPYLLQALYEWIMDSEMIPHIVVDTKVNEPTVPKEYVKDDGTIVLNICEKAANFVSFDDEAITFQCRFDGTQHDIRIPYGSIVSIYAKETGSGMIFTPVDDNVGEPEVKRPPPLRLVVDNDK